MKSRMNNEQRSSLTYLARPAIPEERGRLNNRLFVNAGVLDCKNRRLVAGLASSDALGGGIRSTAWILPLVQKRRLGTSVRRARGRGGTREPIARLDDRSGPPTCGGRKRGGKTFKDWDVPMGGFNTKIHAAVSGRRPGRSSCICPKGMPRRDLR